MTALRRARVALLAAILGVLYVSTGCALKPCEGPATHGPGAACDENLPSASRILTAEQPNAPPAKPKPTTTDHDPRKTLYLINIFWYSVAPSAGTANASRTGVVARIGVGVSARGEPRQSFPDPSGEYHQPVEVNESDILDVIVDRVLSHSAYGSFTCQIIKVNTNEEIDFRRTTGRGFINCQKQPGPGPNPNRQAH